MSATPQSTDAFRLMTYRCSACGSEERVWNSRDGVTPYVIDCRACTGDARHVRWGEDVYDPHHKPALGDRIFVDLNPERALQKRVAYVEQWWDNPQYAMRDHPVLGPLGKDGAAAHLAQADVESFAPHTPDLIDVTESALAWLAGGAQ